MEKRCYIYAHRRPDTGEIFYIGRGTVHKKASGKVFKNLYSRAFVKHLANKYWMHIAALVGFEVEILEDHLSWDRSIELEKFYIQKYGRKDLGEGTLVNFTDGGEGTPGAIASEKAREIQRVRMSGESNPNKRPENRKRASERMKADNPVKDAEVLAKRVASWRKGLEEGKFTHPRLGKPREDLKERNLKDNPAKRPEVKEKLRQIAYARARAIQDVATGVVYKSIRAYCEELNVKGPTARDRVLRGKLKWIDN
jgi:hypothetical protein